MTPDTEDWSNDAKKIQFCITGMIYILKYITRLIQDYFISWGRFKMI